MFHLSFSAKTLLSFTLCSLLAACGSESSISEKSQTSNTDKITKQEVEVRFAARVGNEAIRCETMSNSIAGTANSQPTFTDVRMYVSEIALINEKGDAVTLDLIQDGKWQYQNVALLDFETGTGSCSNGNEQTNHTVRGTVPQGNYHSIRFTLGVPAALNHYGIDGDDAVSPLDVAGMNWSWQKGHKHLRIDVQGWNIHLGTTGCEVTDSNAEVVDCTSSRPNRPQYQLDNFDLNSSTVVFDYQKLVANSDLSMNAPSTAQGCMSASNDPDCQGVFDHLGLDLITGECKAGNCSTSQSWVSVE